MLVRVPEPELMDSKEQAHAYSEADFSEAHDLYVANVLERVGPLRGLVLDIGCGPGDVLVRLARANPDAHFVGVDAGPRMLALAAARIEREGLTDRIRLERRHLPDTTLGNHAFDAAVSNSVLHHLADPGVLWSTIARVVRPGGAVAVGDLRRPEHRDALDALVALHAADAPAVLRDDYAHSLAAAYTVGEVAHQCTAVGLDVEVEAPTDRHLLVTGRV